jgi:hypothetical protein
LSVSRARIEATIFALLEARAPGATICPSDAARALGDGEVEWRALMPAVREVAAELARAGRLRTTQRGQEVDALSAHGPIRLARPEGLAVAVIQNQR